MLAVIELFRFSAYAILAVAAATSLNTFRSKLLLAKISVGVGCLLAAYGLIQKAGWDPIQWGYVPRGRVFAFCGHPNTLAGVLSFTLTISMGLMFCARKGVWAWLLLLSLLAQSMCLVFTFSRGGWIAAAAAMLIFVFFYGVVGRANLKLKSRLFFSSLVAIVAGVIIALSIGSSYDPLSPDPSKAASVSLETRKRLWRGTAQMIADHPWTGVGPGYFNHAFPEYRPKDLISVNPSINAIYAHSEWLHLAAEYGVPLTLIFAAVVLSCFWRSLRLLKSTPDDEKPLQLAFIAATAGLWIQASADVSLRIAFTAVPAWIGLGVISGPQSLKGYITNMPKFARATMVSALAIFLTAGIWFTVYLPFKSQLSLRDGQIAKAQGYWEDAVRKFNSAIRLDGMNIDAHYEKAICLVEMQEYNAALREYEIIEVLSPNYVQIHYNMGMIHVFMQEWGKAAERFRDADKVGSLPPSFSVEAAVGVLSSDSPPQKKDQVLFRMFVNSRFRDEARLRATKLEKLTPDVVALAASLESAGKFERAISAYEVALEMTPGDRVALNNLAGLLFAHGERKQAIIYYREFHKQYPSDEIGAVNLAGALATTNEMQTAVQVIQEFLKVRPDAQQARSLLSRLRAH